MTEREDQGTCICGHDRKAHERGKCRGARLRARGRDSAGKEYKADVITEAMPAAECECREFKPTAQDSH